MTVKEFHDSIDRMLAAIPELKQSCCHTCTLATCCNEPVYVGPDEVQWMLDSLTPDQLDYVRDKAAEWSVKAVGTGMLKEDMPDDFAYRWLPHKITCPFLKDRRCIAYERRPMACRVWFVKDTPENCDMPNRRHQRIADIPPDANEHGLASLDYFDAHHLNGTVRVDHLGVILVELLFGIKLHSGANLTSENMKEKRG